jgi:hypothetical protein
MTLEANWSYKDATSIRDIVHNLRILEVAAEIVRVNASKPLSIQY